jgi:hypothetical protein
MRKIAFALAIVIGLGLAGMGTSAAQAAGPVSFQISAGGVHVGVGQAYHGSYGVAVPNYYRSHYYGSPYVWVPDRYVRHGSHLHFVPGHWELRQTSHHHHHGGYPY